MSSSKCLINIEKDEEQVVKDFAGLHPSFKNWIKVRDDSLRIPSVNIIKYIVSCYDHESDIVREHKQRWTVKKKEAARVSGILFMRDMYEDEVDSILYCKNEIINRITVRYLALLSDRDFLMYAIYNEVLINQSRQMLNFEFERPGDVTKAKQNIEDIQSDIQRLEQKMFSGDDVRELKNILQQETNKFMVSELRPENLVTKNEQGESVVDSPYGKSYQIPDLNFLDDR